MNVLLYSGGMRDEKRPITTVSVKQVYVSSFMHVEEHAVLNEDGTPGLYNVMRHGDGVTVLATSPEGDYYLIREYKYAIARYILQLAGGTIDEGEKPLETAQRELLEETGLSTNTWISYGPVYAYPTNIPSVVHLFHAEGVRPVREPEPGIQLLRLTDAEIRRRLANNDIIHAASLVALLTHLGGFRPAA
jgi:ADP-ribose pyrophosphatase